MQVEDAERSEGLPVVGMIGVLNLPYPQGVLTFYEGCNASAGVTWQRCFCKPKAGASLKWAVLLLPQAAQRQFYWHGHFEFGLSNLDVKESGATLYTPFKLIRVRTRTRCILSEGVSNA